MKRSVLLLTAVLGFWTATVKAAIVTTSPGLPPVTTASGQPVGYLSPQDVHAIYSGPGLAVVLSQIVHSGFTNIQVQTVGANETENFDSALSGGVSLNGSPVLPFLLTGPVQVEAFGKAGQTTGTFNTQMLSMDMTGAVGGHSVEVKTDPANPTTGQTTITDIGGGNFRITSFFDVFTELSIDGGPFIPQSNGPTTVTATALPEPASMAVWAGLIAIGLAACRWRRKKQ